MHAVVVSAVFVRGSFPAATAAVMRGMTVPGMMMTQPEQRHQQQAAEAQAQAEQIEVHRISRLETVRTERGTDERRTFACPSERRMQNAEVQRGKRNAERRESQPVVPSAF